MGIYRVEVDFTTDYSELKMCNLGVCNGEIDSDLGVSSCLSLDSTNNSKKIWQFKIKVIVIQFNNWLAIFLQFTRGFLE